SAALFRHEPGVLQWRNAQPETEICVDLDGSRSIVTRTGGGIFDGTIAKRGTIWMSPAGLQEDILSKKRTQVGAGDDPIVFAKARGCTCIRPFSFRESPITRIAHS